MRGGVMHRGYFWTWRVRLDCNIPLPHTQIHNTGPVGVYFMPLNVKCVSSSVKP